MSGAFLRVDLPSIACELGERDKVFYTDCDVIFQSEVVTDLLACPVQYFSVTPEFTIGDYEHMNTGAMLINVSQLRDSLPEFRQFIIDNMETPRTDSWDQSAYRHFYRTSKGVRLWDELPATLNWKPCRAITRPHKIIHFHGPKPYQRNFIDSHYSQTKHLTGGAYEELVDLYETSARSRMRPGSQQGREFRRPVIARVAPLL